MYEHRRLRFVSSAAIAVVICSAWAATTRVVAADDGSATPSNVLLVAQPGAALAVAARGYTDCVDQGTEVSLIFPGRRTEFPPGSPHDVGYEPFESATRFSQTQIHVDASGGFDVSLSVPEITADRWQGFVIMSGNCLGTGLRVLTQIAYAAPITPATLDGLRTGLSPADIPPGGSVIVIPSVLIDGMPGANDDISGGYILDHMTAYANGERCAALNLKPADARDPAGDGLLVIGSADEPSACRERGAELIFTAWPSDTLLSFRTTLVPGVMQPIQLNPFAADAIPSVNAMLPAAPVVDGSRVVEPPAVGSGQLMRPEPHGRWLWVTAALFAAAVSSAAWYTVGHKW